LRSLAVRGNSSRSLPGSTRASEASETTVLTNPGGRFPAAGLPRRPHGRLAPTSESSRPIRLGDDRLDRNERRLASLRWLAGATLAGALRRDPDRRGSLSRPRQPIQILARRLNLPRRPQPADSQDAGVNPSKGDRLLRPVDIVSDKQTFKAPTIIKVGDKEVVKARPFTRLETTLTMTPTGFADAVPSVQSP